MSLPIRVLVVEDSENDALLLIRELKRADYVPEWRRVETTASMKQALAEERWDVIISDYNLPTFSGAAAFRLLKETGLDVPFIIVSGSIGEEVAVDLMKIGVNDYVMKNNMKRLGPAVERELRDAAEREARRVAEGKLKQAERLRTIGELTSSLIHDLKNPLNSILLSAGFLAESEREEEELAKYYDIIVKQIDVIVAMSDDVLDFARGTVNLNLKPTNPVTLIEEVIETYSPIFRKVSIELIRPRHENLRDIPIIMADDNKLWRVLQNLLINAKDAMPQGGQIRLDIHGKPKQAILEISDTGGGIPAEIRETLFSPFITFGKKNGTGLGLWIVKNIIEAHSGTVSFEVNEGVGTTFRIVLPRHISEEAVPGISTGNVSESQDWRTNSALSRSR